MNKIENKISFLRRHLFIRAWCQIIKTHMYFTKLKEILYLKKLQKAKETKNNTLLKKFQRIIKRNFVNKISSKSSEDILITFRYFLYLIYFFYINYPNFNILLLILLIIIFYDLI